MPALLDPQTWIAFLTLAALEIVLGLDNLVFISILVGKLPQSQRRFAYRVGLALAMGTRILLLLFLSWLMGLTRPLFNVFQHGVSGRDLILGVGGLFLVAKSTREIHDKLEGAGGGQPGLKQGVASLGGILVQIMALDVIFSLDSVITAVGMAQNIVVMIAAIVVAVLVMMIFAKTVGDFVHQHPTIKMLALSFLLLIGVMLVAEASGHEVPKGYIYFAMAFSLAVEILNMKAGHHSARPVDLHEG